MDELGLVICPLYADHVIPKRFLDHHLEGHCDEANNRLRKYFQSRMDFSSIEPAPDDYLPELSKDILNDHNRQMLYFLSKNLPIPSRP